METNLYKTTETYAILEKFNEPIGNLDKRKIDRLSERYAKMFEQTKATEMYIRNNLDEIISKI